jgi:hypothetical protein
MLGQAADTTETFVIDLAPLGGRKVTSEELEAAAQAIYRELQKLADPSPPPAPPPSPKWPVSGDQLKTYASYGAVGLGTLWLLRKIL